MEIDIVTKISSLFQMMKNKAEADSQKYGDSNWQLTSMHVMSPEVLSLLESPDTPPNIKHLILMNSFVGNQWVEVGEVAPLIFEDTPIIDWGLAEDES